MKTTASQLNQDLQNQSRVTLIDVRTPVEHEEMHLEGSLLMPLDSLSPQSVKDATVDFDQCVLICHSGKRAQRAYEKLQAAGCQNLRILEGGVTAWQSAGLPLKRSEKKRLPLMRQVHLTIGLCVLTASCLAVTMDPRFAWVAAVFGAGLTLAGATGWCGLALVLSKMPWNKVNGSCGTSSCSV
jgi:rhodanese-related sulfurtransferase